MRREKRPVEVSFSGGREEARTPDLINVSDAL
jgi:hypothetical protein